MRRAQILLVIALFLLILGAPLAYAQSSGDYDLAWNAITSGGGPGSAGGEFELGGAIGLLEAGEMRGGNYVLSGGFWMGEGGSPVDPGAPASIYLPLILAESD